MEDNDFKKQLEIAENLYTKSIYIIEKILYDKNYIKLWKKESNYDDAKNSFRNCCSNLANIIGDLQYRDDDDDDCD